MVLLQAGAPVLWEAGGPVMRTPYPEWIDRDVDGHVVVKRLKEVALLTPDVVATMKIAGERDMGKGYDIYFAPDTERIHCIELVQRIHQAGAGVTIGEVQRFGDMDFSGADARRMLKDRFGERFR